MPGTVFSPRGSCRTAHAGAVGRHIHGTVYGSIEHPNGHMLIGALQIELDPDCLAPRAFGFDADRFEVAAPPARSFDGALPPVVVREPEVPRFPFAGEAAFRPLCPPRIDEAFKSTPVPEFVEVTLRH